MTNEEILEDYEREWKRLMDQVNEVERKIVQMRSIISKEAVEQSVQADLPCSCRITRGFVRRVNPACVIHGDKTAIR